MAGTVTAVEIRHAPVKQVTWDWLSDGAGAADDTTDDVGGYTGKLVEVRIIPDGGGTAPDELYDVVVTDGDGYDLLNGLGGNCPATNTVVLLENVLGVVTSSQLTLGVTNSGAANGGIVIVKVRP